MLKRLELLSRQGAIRPLDYQFAKFIATTVAASDCEETRQVVTLAAAQTSYELGQGHVCLLLSKLERGHVLGLGTEHSSQLLEGLPALETWGSVLSASAAVSVGQGATPLVLEHGRLYLNRYWQFEQTVASRLKQSSGAASSAAVAMPQMAAKLDELFARSYTYLFEALQKLRNGEKAEPDSPQARQAEVCDKLDVVAAGELDWGAIDRVLTAATHASDLAVLDTLVPNAVCLNWQKVAAAVALTRHFAVISGGPGTGKTTTVAKLLVALVTQAMQASGGDAEQVPTIKLVAPTGKAAARLTESIGAAVQSLVIEKEVKDLIPTQSSTIHRLLGSIPNRVEFRHNCENPLHLDVLVVDEASMVDLPMMARLLDAMPPHAKLILLGDRDQLASVEAGAVLGDICSFSNQEYSPEQGEQLSLLTGYRFAAAVEGGAATVADSLCMLRKSYRFHAQSGIGQLAKAINGGQPHQVEQVWQQGFKDIHQYPLCTESYERMINMTVNFYRDYLDAIEIGEKPEKVLKAFSRVRLLCALREGDFGVSGLNPRIERGLMRAGKINPGDDTWYVGRPVMITRNDHGLGLYNGDIGIAMLDAEPDLQTGKRRLRVYFDMPDGSIRAVLPSRLPEHETVYAMTIHKSQGSEFADTLMVLPTDFSPILTRELIYTGVTRAKEKLYMFALPEIVHRSVRLRTERASGLAQLLG